YRRLGWEGTRTAGNGSVGATTGRRRPFPAASARGFVHAVRAGGLSPRAGRVRDGWRYDSKITWPGPGGGHARPDPLGGSWQPGGHGGRAADGRGRAGRAVTQALGGRDRPDQ